MPGGKSLLALLLVGALLSAYATWSGRATMLPPLERMLGVTPEFVITADDPSVRASFPSSPPEEEQRTIRG